MFKIMQQLSSEYPNYTPDTTSLFLKTINPDDKKYQYGILKKLIVTPTISDETCYEYIHNLLENGFEMDSEHLIVACAYRSEKIVEMMSNYFIIDYKTFKNMIYEIICSKNKEIFNFLKQNKFYHSPEFRELVQRDYLLLKYIKEY